MCLLYGLTANNSARRPVTAAWGLRPMRPSVQGLQNVACKPTICAQESPGSVQTTRSACLSSVSIQVCVDPPRITTMTLPARSLRLLSTVRPDGRTEGHPTVAQRFRGGETIRPTPLLATSGGRSAELTSGFDFQRGVSYYCLCLFACCVFMGIAA